MPLLRTLEKLFEKYAHNLVELKFNVRSFKKVVHYWILSKTKVYRYGSISVKDFRRETLRLCQRTRVYSISKCMHREISLSPEKWDGPPSFLWSDHFFFLHTILLDFCAFCFKKLSALFFFILAPNPTAWTRAIHFLNCELYFALELVKLNDYFIYFHLLVSFLFVLDDKDLTPHYFVVLVSILPHWAQF